MLDGVIERDYVREPLLERLEQSAVRVYDSIILSPASLRDASGELIEVAESLRAIAERGVFVFAYLPADLPDGFEPREYRAERFEIIEWDDLVDFVDDVRTRLENRGLRVGRTLPIVGPPSDEFLPVLDAIRRDTTPVSPRREMPPAFSTTTLAEAFDQEWLILPVADEDGLVGGARALLHLLDSLLTVPRINVAETATEIQGESTEILDHFADVGRLASKNVQRGLDLLLQFDERLADAETGIFDHRSGAVFFSPHEWRTLAADQSKLRTTLLDYFSQKLPYRRPDRPCYSRILFTPTKLLLRGEQYYVNMRNVSPFERLIAMYDELDSLRNVYGRIDPLLCFECVKDWKLIMALTDQVRNIGLQLLSFAHAAVPALSDVPELREDFRELWGTRDEGVHGLVREAVGAFYSCLLMDLTSAQAAMRAAMRLWYGCDEQLRCATSQMREHMQTGGRYATADGLVRRWREADHPGENLLATLIAADQMQETDDLHVVGIGWGGIELPLVFDHVSGRLAPAQTRHLHISRWSHYRAPEKQVHWDHFPEPEDDFFLDGQPVVLLDDNTLTGITLERIRDNLLLRGAGSVSMFVTRYSGERRHAQMKMAGHGAVDPDVLRDQIGGYLGETAFARSWSTDRYQNPIGVFSLARRRILECIYNNSTVELYEREGF